MPEITLLAITAAAIAFTHTLLGPDHYLPFIVMAKSGRWSLRKTAAITVLCGVGHVIGSVVLGLLGIAFGAALFRLKAIESLRGDLAAWALIAFGLLYLIWGLRKAARPALHVHHHHQGEHVRLHTHDHAQDHAHAPSSNTTPWVLFVIFVLGPCEPLIPLLIYPAAQNSLAGLLLVTGVFGVVTVLTMLSIVLISTLGLNRLPLGKMERYAHAQAGAAILLSGLAIQFLGL